MVKNNYGVWVENQDGLRYKFTKLSREDCSRLLRDCRRSKQLRTPLSVTHTGMGITYDVGMVACYGGLRRLFGFIWRKVWRF